MSQGPMAVPGDEPPLPVEPPLAGVPPAPAPADPPRPPAAPPVARPPAPPVACDPPEPLPPPPVVPPAPVLPPVPTVPPAPDEPLPCRTTVPVVFGDCGVTVSVFPETQVEYFIDPSYVSVLPDVV